jgi:hypothetical protein
MTLADLAATVPCDASTVSRIEAGTLSPGRRFAAACDEAFPGMGGWFGRFCHDSRAWAGPHPPWFRDWVEIERRATVIRWWEPLLIPGLLQTEGNARACSAGDPTMEGTWTSGSPRGWTGRTCSPANPRPRYGSRSASRSWGTASDPPP